MTAITSWSTSRETVLLEHAGGKGAGLLQLPGGWVPPFFIVACGWAFESALDHLLAVSRADDVSRGLIVRSNAVSESATDVRGAYSSIPVSADSGAALEAIRDVLGQPTRPGDVMLAIVQVAVASVARGHLSNERHVAERRTQWVLEEETDGPSTSIQRVGARDMGSDVLKATNRGELLTALRHVVFRLGGGERRLHCEWVWDGARVWIVQRDTVPERRGGHVHEYLASRPAARPQVEEPRTILIRRLSANESAAWSKLSRPVTFDALGMPISEVWHLGGREFVTDAAERSGRVLVDLDALLSQGPIVVRCDVRAARSYADLSLPTSDPVQHAEEALEFMHRTATTAFKSIPPDDWAFLPAVLVPARASVMAQARPRGQRVRLDALWGYPDGVGLLPHDKWSHDTLTDAVDEHRAHKATCCLYVPGRGWRFELVPSPHDWGHTINAEEVRTASSWARRLADHLGREVQLMVLARIGGRRGPDAMLPWHYTDHVVAPSRRHVTAAPSTGVVTISRPEDLAGVDLAGRRGVLLRPEIGSRRDPAFLTSVGARAASADVPVYFEGSVLGHPYYLIKSAGAVVVPVGPNEPEGVRIEYNKLVRDAVPEIVRSAGGIARVVRASPGEAHWLLRQKLVEEAFEVAEATGDQVVEELADLAETVLALCRQAGIDAAQVERARLDKLAARGGFDGLVYLQATDSGLSADDDPLEVQSLFGSDAAGGIVPALRDERAIVVIDESNARRIVLRVPVVPPLRRGILLREYGLEIGESTVGFRHTGAELEITIEQSKLAQVAGQLSLPVDPT
jgi:predicted house-cleaning noncanonical NTP pyrophosphatase (MazG superfamily)